ncbi:hypothetical protein FBEOM_3566 [Fusarium beomiforme]|uniref:Uncharacterized protein n=1 Tax=Fusarium beomiforme TaxID=44412 RepID=A0A9P5APE6_9HYPO|nr:hypothetical protein FBEOM_3566 [Fusarium beomiforme]
MSSSALVTSLPIFGDTGSATFVAEVIGADADHTTYVLNCPYVDPESEEFKTMDDCGVYNNTYTLGPWMSKTLPPGAASTGDLDLFITMPGDSEDDWRFSVHCEMSRTVATKCTTINVGGNDDGHPTATITDAEELDDYGLATFSFGPVSITAGQELLNAKHASATATATGSSDATKTKASESDSTGSETSGVATPTSTSGATSSFARMFGALSVAGVAAALVM